MQCSIHHPVISHNCSRCDEILREKFYVAADKVIAKQRAESGVPQPGFKRWQPNK